MTCDCPNCKKDNILNGTLIAHCSLCSHKLSVKYKFQVMDDKSLVCEKCIKLHYTTCPNCSKLHKTDKMKSVSQIGSDGVAKTNKVCESCYGQYYKECCDCHSIFDRHSTIQHQNKFYCKTCFDKQWQMCGHCNNIRPRGQFLHTIYDNRVVCEDCYNVYGPIQRYETKPKLEFIGAPPHYYGVELEVELVDQNKSVRGAKAGEVVNLFDKNFIVVKEDGSLRSGFEICTQPATLVEHISRWDKFFDKLPKNLHSFNSPNCGLHVHCSKKPLSLLTIAKIVVFTNDEKNKAFVETIAGRRSCSYACIQKKEYGTVKNQITGRVGRSERYEAVNLVNKDTIEFRLFKGTLKRESFYKALEFCDALIHFCMTGNYGIAHCRDQKNFIEYVSNNRKTYSHLYAFICAKVLKKETKWSTKYGFKVPNAEGGPEPTNAAHDNSQM